MKKTLKILGGACAVVALAAAGLFGTEYLLSTESAANQPPQGGEQRATRVGISEPERREFATEVSAVGTIMPVRQVDITPSVAGRVTDVPARSGTAVSEGDVLLRLDDRAQRATLRSAEATLGEAQQNLNRVEELAEANTAAEQQLEQARATFARAEGEVMSARAALEDRTLTAPFDGTLGFVDTDPGAYVTTSSVLTQLSDLSVMQVDLSLPERYFDRVEPGQTVELSVPAYPEATFSGEVTVRGSNVESGSRSFNVRAEVSNADRRLVGGMFAQTRLVFDTYDGLALPDDAIISEGARTFVYTVADGQASRRTVSLGGSAGSLTEVTDGISEGDRVVVTGWNTLRDGAPVEVAEDVAREGLE
ncbi:efflux RND transporter periplasmic adaptor subunit [Roseivivax sediminis]|uniref:Membrane fusion protein, multidrug efflux system n=1 Tax=Roseivivax sediminis TaxID=936889 RepID=A0A1I1VLX7_9RHOB|nr:efflux RND transporter periplasmic adaptor subunit [Roseivivax sediminis]SFD83824.1 membrane fusion protein, multidrug efflux system [Roseivivax sediminis]